MSRGKRFGLSAMQKSDLWRRWKAGQSLHEIGRAFGKSHSSIRCDNRGFSLASWTHSLSLDSVAVEAKAQ